MAPTEDSGNRGRARPWAGGRHRPRRPVGARPEHRRLRAATDPVPHRSSRVRRAAQTPRRARHAGGDTHPAAADRAARPRAPRPTAPPAAQAPRARRQRAAARAARPAGRRKRSRRSPGRRRRCCWTGGMMALRAGRRRRRRRTSSTSTSTATSTRSTSACEQRRASTDGPVNILVIGTDKRTGKGNERLRRRGQRRARRHHDPAARLQGPHERDRAEHPARHDHRHPRLPDEAGGRLDEGHPGRARASASTPASARTAGTPAAPCAPSRS